jgi:stage V sporulation protein SpoVS
MGSSYCGDCCQDTPDRRRGCLTGAARDKEKREISSHGKARVQENLKLSAICQTHWVIR